MLPYDAVKTFAADDMLIVILGGDSANKYTIQALCESNLARKVVLAGFRFGSGNDFLSMLNINSNRDAFTALRGFLANPERYSKRIDLLQVSLPDYQCIEYAGFMAGFGISAAISHRTSNFMKRCLPGKVAYRMAVNKVLLLDYIKLSSEVTVLSDEGKTLEDNLISLMVTNGKYAGAGMQPVPWSVPWDGTAEVFAVNYINPVRLNFIFNRVYDGSHTELEECHFISGRQFTIMLKPGLLLQLDGEVIKKEKQALRVEKAEIEVLESLLNSVYLPVEEVAENDSAAG